MTALPTDYDEDPGRFAANQFATARYVARADVHHDVAHRFTALGYRRVLDIGGGNGSLAKLLAALGHEARHARLCDGHSLIVYLMKPSLSATAS